MYESFYSSPMGTLRLAYDDHCLAGLHRVAEPTPAFSELNLDILTQTKLWLDCYFDGKRPNFLPALSLSGTPFQRQVWEILLTIPYGQLVTYGDIAKEIARQRGLKTMSAQAVGGAVGANPIGIIVPCHRVIGQHHNLTGYAGGLKMKLNLLALEGIDISALNIPHDSRFYDLND